MPVPAGPDGGELRSPRGLLVRCLIYVRTLMPLWRHRCPPGSFVAEGDEDPPVEDEPPRTGRGDAVVPHGDVESNPGPSPTRKDKGVVRPREQAHMDVDMAPSAADPTFVPGCPGGPDSAVLPSYEGGAMAAPPPLRARPPTETDHEDWDGDLAHQPRVSSDATYPKRGRSTGPNAAGNLWQEASASPSRSTSAPPLTPVTPPVTLQRLVHCRLGSCPTYRLPFAQPLGMP